MRTAIRKGDWLCGLLSGRATGCADCYQEGRLAVRTAITKGDWLCGLLSGRQKKGRKNCECRRASEMTMMTTTMVVVMMMMMVMMMMVMMMMVVMVMMMMMEIKSIK